MNGIWFETGTNIESNSGFSCYSYSGSGSYWDSGDGWSSSGTLSEFGGDSDSYGYTTNYELDEDGQWSAATGSGGSTGNGQTQWAYSGNGVYSFTTDRGIIYGIIDENGVEDTCYCYSTTAICTNGEWSESGESVDSENGSYHYAFSGSGDAEHSWNGWSSSGTLSEIGNQDDSYEYTTNYVLGDDANWEATDGSGGFSGSGSYQLAFSGSGDYSASSYCGGSMSGSFTQYETDGDSYNYNTTAVFADDQWSESGTGSYTEYGSKNYGFSGSGSYSRNSYYETWNGTLEEDGTASESFSYTTQYELDDGDWYASSGSGGSSGSGSTHSSYSGSCSDWSEGILEGSAQESGFDDTSYEFETEAVFDPFWGDWTETGMKTASGSGGSSQSYSGSGDYSITNPLGLGNSALSGSASGNGIEETSYEFTKTFDLDPFGQWQVSGGSANVAGSGETHFSGSASGSAQISAPVTSSVPSTLDYSDSDNSFYQYSQDYMLAPNAQWLAESGTGGASGDGTRDWSYSGSGSYTRAVSFYLPNTGDVWVSGSDHATYQYQTEATSVQGLWSETGSASASDSGTTSASYSNSGSYTHDLDMYSVDESISGTIQESGNLLTAYSYTKTSTLKNDGNWTTPVGYGVTTIDGYDQWSYSGSGTYTTVGVYGAPYWIDGTVQESGSDQRETHFTIISTTDPNNGLVWNRSGVGVETGSYESNFSYTGSYSWDEDSSVDGLVHQGTNTATTTINATMYAYGTNSENGYNTSSGEYTRTWALPQYSGWNVVLSEVSSESECYAEFTRNATLITVYPNDTAYNVRYFHNESLTESVVQTMSRPNAYGYINPFAGFESETTVSSGIETVHLWSSDSWGDALSAFGLGDDGCVQQSITTYYDDFSSSHSSSCVNYVSKHWINSDGDNYSFGEPDPALIESPGFYTLPYMYLASSEHYSPLKNEQGIEHLKSEMGINYSCFPADAEPSSYDILNTRYGGPSFDALLQSSMLTTMKSEASWMTTDYARMPTAFGLLAPTTAANMSTGNQNNSTKMPWSAPTHNSTPRAESIPLRAPEEATLLMVSLAPEAVDAIVENDDIVFTVAMADKDQSGSSRRKKPDFSSKAVRDMESTISQMVPQNMLSELAEALGMPNPDKATVSKIRDYINNHPWEKESKEEIEDRRKKVAEYKAKEGYELFLHVAKLYLKALALDRNVVDDIGKRMINNYFSKDTKDPFKLTLADMKYMAKGGRPSLRGAVDIHREEGWREALQLAISSQKEVEFVGTFSAFWDNGSIGGYTIHYEGKIVPIPNTNKAYWEGVIWFTDRFDFDPYWQWSEKHNHRSAMGERRVRIAYILNFGTDFDVISVKANAKQASGSNFMIILSEVQEE